MFIDPQAARRLDWAKGDGLLPAVIQDADTLRVLMLGYMDEGALAMTCDSGKVTFFSRSKQRLWMKGESSENYLDVVRIEVDCDNDTLLVLARPQGPTCHRGTTSCFATAPGNFLAELDALVARRKAEMPDRLIALRSGLAAYVTSGDAPAVVRSADALRAAMLAHRAAAAAAGKNLLVPKPKPEAAKARPGQRQRKPLPKSRPR